ncbi:MAG: RNA polymerase sporulation sigma factor SigK [Clostridia bacterium]|nr:RNA polymerase sporulation sigma factor SigK [Clostridia bacterium]
MFDSFFDLFKNLLVFILHVNSQNSFPPALKAKEEEQLVKLAEKGDRKAKNKLIEHNLRLVAHVIKKYYANTSDQEDLISIGTIGLIKAIDTFKSDKGTRLATYAARCIENEILMYFRSQKKNSQDISVNEPIDTDNEGNPLTLIDLISTEDTILDDIFLVSMSKKLYEFIEEIDNERDKTIIFMRYGLNNKKPLTQKEVAKRLSISRSYVSRIEKRVLAQLKQRFDEEVGETK